MKLTLNSSGKSTQTPIFLWTLCVSERLSRCVSSRLCPDSGDPCRSTPPFLSDGLVAPAARPRTLPSLHASLAAGLEGGERGNGVATTACVHGAPPPRAGSILELLLSWRRQRVVNSSSLQWVLVGSRVEWPRPKRRASTASGMMHPTALEACAPTRSEDLGSSSGAWSMREDGADCR
jgi:hypothetical protein